MWMWLRRTKWARRKAATMRELLCWKQAVLTSCVVSVYVYVSDVVSVFVSVVVVDVVSILLLVHVDVSLVHVP